MSATIILYLTLTIVGIITLLTIYALASTNLRVVNAAPSVLTSFGIFGTFLGITIGLFGFDPTNAAGSLPMLFDGIRLAFWTSVTGIFGALLVKLRFLFRPGLLTGAEIARRDNRTLMKDLVASMQHVESGLTDPDKSPLLSGLSALQAHDGKNDAELKETLFDIREVLGNLQGSMTAASARENAMLSTVQAMGETSAATLKEMQSNTTAVLREAQKETAANMEALQHGTLDAIQTLQKDTASKLSDVQHDSAAAISALTQGSSAEIRELQKRSASELAELVKHSGEQFKSLSDTLNGNQEALLTGLQASALLLDEFRNYRDESINRLQKLQEDIALNLASTMTAGVERIATEFHDTMLGKDGVASQLAKEVSVSHDTLAASLSQQNADNLKKLESIREGLGDLGVGMTKDLSAVAGSTEVLAAAIGSQGAESLKKLEALGAGMEALGRGISTDIGAVTGRLSTLGDVSEGIQTLAGQVGTGFSALEGGIASGGDALATRIMDTIDDLRYALVGPDAGSDGVFNKFIAAQEKTQSALDEIKGALAGGQKQSDQALAALREAVTGFDSGAGTIVEAMRDAQKSSTDSMAKVGKAVEELNAGTVGLAKDMQKSQTNTIDELKNIRKAINDNTAKQQASPKALMKALEETVKQFNSQFSGQFWDKFGAFNEGIGELIEWMDTYRKQIADTLDHQTKAAANMDIAARRFDDVAQNAQMFTDISRSLGSLLTGVDSQRVEMESHLKRFAHIVSETSEALANIETKIIEGNERTNEHVEDISKRIEEQVIRLDHALDDELTKALNSFGRQLAALSEKFVEDYTPLTERLRDVVNIARAS